MEEDREEYDVKEREEEEEEEEKEEMDLIPSEDSDEPGSDIPDIYRGELSFDIPDNEDEEEEEEEFEEEEFEEEKEEEEEFEEEEEKEEEDFEEGEETCVTVFSFIDDNVSEIYKGLGILPLEYRNNTSKFSGCPVIHIDMNAKKFDIFSLEYSLTKAYKSGFP